MNCDVNAEFLALRLTKLNVCFNVIGETLIHVAPDSKLEPLQVGSTRKGFNQEVETSIGVRTVKDRKREITPWA